MVQIRIGMNSQDLDIRPIVIARLPIGDLADDDLVRISKDAIGQGADRVELDAARLTAAVRAALAAASVPVLARIRSAAQWSDPGGFDAVRVEPSGGEPFPRPAVASVFSTRADLLNPGDGWIVPAADFARDPAVPEALVPVVDLTGIGGRAELAAVVADALGRGAGGFITTAPTPVRRAAHVIRAVEHAT